MIEAKRFSGVLNTDDKPENVAGPQHIDAKNVRFYGGPSGLTVENVKGNYVISNDDLPAGTNECIGSFYDSVNQRIIWFNYNSNGDNGIYSLDLKTDTISPIFICGTDSATDILNFTPEYPVHSCNIVYREPDLGDLLYWTDGYNRPKYLNISTVSSLAPFTEDMINAAKNAPLLPSNRVGGGSVITYGSDSSISVNLLKNKLFRFSYRWVYKNGEKSTFAPISSVANPSSLPVSDTVNNYINVTVVGGPSDYKAIEIVGQQNLNNTWSDFFLIDTLDRNEYSIAPNANYAYKFYNNSSYPVIAPEETDLYFSWLPDKANTLELLNGNVLIYGGITEGYNKIPRSNIDVILAAGLNDGGITSSNLTAHSYCVFITNVQPGNTYNISFSYSSGAGGDASPKNVTYTAVGGDNPQTVATSLIALLNGNNIICTSIGSGAFIINTTTNSGTITSFSATGTGTGPTNGTLSIWDWSTQQRFALIYFDDRGKPIDIVSFSSESNLDNTDFNVNIPQYKATTSNSPYPVVSALINHLPPQNASSYQWLRASLTPPPTYIVTNDYQDPGDGFLYFCIQNFIEQKNKDTGFIPSYEFADGDYVKVIAAASLSGSATIYSSYTDQVNYQVLGTVQRTMPIPASLGTYLKVKKPSPAPVGYTASMLIKIYTPLINTNQPQQIFYEWGEQYGFQTIAGVKYHLGQAANQTATQPAVFHWMNGDMWFVNRNYYQFPNSTSTVSTAITSPRYNEYFESSVNSNGRVWVIDENAKEEYNSVMVRWGGKYQSGTTFNELNIFRPNDFDLVDRSKGDIRRFKARDRILRVFQDRGTGQYGVYMRFIQNNQGQSELVTTNEIITTNNIQYYQGVYGVSGYPTNLVSTQNADYFVDVVTGRAIRLGGNGLTDLGLAYKGQFYLSQLVVPYNKNLRLGAYKAKVFGFFDYFNNEYHTLLSGGADVSIYIYSQVNDGTNYDLYLFGNPVPGDIVSVTVSDGNVTQTFSYTAILGDNHDTVLMALSTLINNSAAFNCIYVPSVVPTSPGSYISVTPANPLLTVTGSASINYTQTINGHNFSFNETRNAFCSFYDYHPEWAMGAQDMIYTWKDGEVWKHDSNTYCNFYGSQYNASLTVVFNNNLLQKKSWNSINEIGSGVWAVPSMYTNVKTYGNTSQVSNLVEAEFTILEGNPSSAIKRDANSPGGKINGDFMKGNYLVAKFEKQNASNYITLSEVSVRATDSPLTAK